MAPQIVPLKKQIELELGRLGLAPDIERGTAGAAVFDRTDDRWEDLPAGWVRISDGFSVVVGGSKEILDVLRCLPDDTEFDDVWDAMPGVDGGEWADEEQQP